MRTIDTALAEKFGLTDLTPRYAPTEVLVMEGRSGRLVPVTRSVIYPAGTAGGPIGTNPRDEVRMRWEVVPEDRRV